MDCLHGRLDGFIEKVYKGKDTLTAHTEVDNINKTISVDVITYDNPAPGRIVCYNEDGNLQSNTPVEQKDVVNLETLNNALETQGLAIPEIIDLTSSSSYHKGKISVVPQEDSVSQSADFDNTDYRARLDFENGKIVIEYYYPGAQWQTVEEVTRGFVFSDDTEASYGHRPAVAWAFDGVCDYSPVVVDENDYDYWVIGKEAEIPYKNTADGTYTISNISANQEDINFKEVEDLSIVDTITSTELVTGAFYKNTISLTRSMDEAKSVQIEMSNGMIYPAVISSTELAIFCGEDFEISDLTVNHIYYKN